MPHFLNEGLFTPNVSADAKIDAHTTAWKYYIDFDCDHQAPVSTSTLASKRYRSVNADAQCEQSLTENLNCANDALNLSAELFANRNQ